MGRRPDPQSVKAAKAPVRSARKAPPAQVQEAEAPEGGLRPPAWLKGAGRDIWLKRAPVLRDMRLLTAADEEAFARYCRNFAKWLQLRDQLDKRGYTYLAATTNGGKLRRADPTFLIADRLERQMMAIEDRFGMNPAERQRIMMARAAGAGAGDLFGDRREGDVAATAAEAAEPIESPVGFLN